MFSTLSMVTCIHTAAVRPLDLADRNRVRPSFYVFWFVAMNLGKSNRKCTAKARSIVCKGL